MYNLKKKKLRVFTWPIDLYVYNHLIFKPLINLSIVVGLIEPSEDTQKLPYDEIFFDWNKSCTQTFSDCYELELLYKNLCVCWNTVAN